MESSIVLMHQAARIRHDERIVRSLAASAQRTGDARRPTAALALQGGHRR